MFYTSGTDTLSPTPIVGAVGLLQFDVMLHRLEHEYGAPCRLERLPRYPRWVVGRGGSSASRAIAGGCCCTTRREHPLLLFDELWTLRSTQQHETSLTFHEVAPQ